MLGDDAARRSLRSDVRGSCLSSASARKSSVTDSEERREDGPPEIVERSLLLKKGNASANESERGRRDPG